MLQRGLSTALEFLKRVKISSLLLGQQRKVYDVDSILSRALKDKDFIKQKKKNKMS